MARTVTAFIDDSGALHVTPEAATISDLTAVLGGGDEAERLARLYLAHRQDFERIFAEHDAMLAAASNVSVLPMGRTGRG